MAVVIAAALASIGASTAVVAVVSAAFIAGSAALQNAQKRKAARKARDAYNASLKDRIANFRSATAPRELVLGRVRKGGPTYPIGSTGTHSERLTFLVLLAGHEIDAVEAAWIEDERQALDASGYVVGGRYSKTVRRSADVSGVVGVGLGTETITVPAGGVEVTLSHDPVSRVMAVQSIAANTRGGSITFRHELPQARVVFIPNDTAGPLETRLFYQWDEFVPRARVRWHLGAGTDTLHAGLKGDFPDIWTDAHRLDGIAYARVDLEYDEAVFQQVPALTFLLRGAKVFDPRTSTTAWSDNPALLIRAAATHELAGSLPSSAVPDAYVITAANACDTSTTYVVGGQTQVRKLYTAGTVHVCGTKPADTIAELAEAMAGRTAWTGEGLIMRAGTYVPPAFALTEDHFAGGAIRVRPEAPRDETLNTVTGTFVDEASNWVEVDLPKVGGQEGAPDWVAQDGGELPIDVEYSAISHAGQAQHVAAVALRDSRQGCTLSAVFQPAAYQLQAFDTVSVTSAYFGWSAKAFEVLSSRWSIEGGNELVLKETGPSIYAMGSAFSAVDSEPNSSLPSPVLTERPQPLSAASGTDQLIIQADGSILSRVLVSWPPAASETVRNGGSVEVAYTRADEALPSGDWPSVIVPGTVSSTHLTGLQDGADYLIRARFINALGRWAWGLQVLHTVIGKTAPPSDITGLDADDDAVRWTHVADPDVVSGGGYELRWQTGTNAEWESAQPLHSGLLTSSPYRWTVRPVGPITLLAKAVDSSGNRSVNAAVSYITLTTQGVRNVVSSHAYAPTFLGTVAAGTINAGVLESDISTLAYGEPARLAYGPADTAYYAPTEYGGIDYTTAWWTPAGAQEGDAILLLTTITGATGLQVEYQADAGLAYGAPGGAVYGGAAEPFYEGGAADWITWPGVITAKPSAAYRWRVRTQSSADQTALAVLTAYLDAPDLEEIVPLTTIPAPSGVRLPLTKSFRGITAVVPGLVVGSTAVAVESQDYNATLGPLVLALDSTRTPVTASASAVIKGY